MIQPGKIFIVTDRHGLFVVVDNKETLDWLENGEFFTVVAECDSKNFLGLAKNNAVFSVSEFLLKNFCKEIE